MVDENPYWYPLEAYLAKLCDPTPVANIDMAIIHQENRLPPKKKSSVDLLLRAKNNPAPNTKNT